MAASSTTYEGLVERGKELYRAGHFAEARDFFREALRIGEQEYGPDAAELIDSLRWLAMAISEKDYSGRSAVEELPLHERELRIAEKAFGPEDARTARAHYSVGLNLCVLARFDEALAHIRHSFELATTIHGDEGHPFVRQARGSLGTLLTEMSRFDEGIPLLQREAEIADRKGHPAGRFAAHWFLARALLKAKRWDEATRSIETSLQLAEARPKGGGAQAEELRAWLEQAKAGARRA
jgi:tetratricopeptide (TPR) repeat protein